MTEKKTPAKKTTAKKAPAKAAEVVATTEETTPIVVKKAPSKSAANYQKGGKQFHNYGKRKNATARVTLRPGTGKITVNDKNTAAEYFGGRLVLLTLINKPLKVVGMEGQYDVLANASGGGKSGQAGAIAHGIAKAIVDINPELKKQLKIEGLITRDSRVKETKKYGRKKARKGFTYRKR